MTKQRKTELWSVENSCGSNRCVSIRGSKRLMFTAVSISDFQHGEISLYRNWSSLLFWRQERAGWGSYLQLGGLTELTSLKEEKRKKKKYNVHAVPAVRTSIIIAHVCNFCNISIFKQFWKCQIHLFSGFTGATLKPKNLASWMF